MNEETEVKMFKTTITELTEYPEWVDSSEGAFVEGYVTVLGIEDIEVYTRKPLDREDFLEGVATVIVGESEVLSDEWIDDNSVYASSDGVTDEYVHVDDLQSLLVPKQELPVIPRFVANWIEEVKPDNSLRVAFEYIAQQKRDNHDDELASWVEEGNSETFARAWVSGYEVEQEPKFHAKVKGWGINGNDGKAFYNGSFPQTLSRRAESVPHTLEEWRGLGIYEDNADFLKVEELEELNEATNSIEYTGEVAVLTKKEYLELKQIEKEYFKLMDTKL